MSKPLTYTFDGMEHTVSIEEQRLIHELGWGIHQRERESFGETLKRMNERPNPTEGNPLPNMFVGRWHCARTMNTTACGLTHADMLMRNAFVELAAKHENNTCAHCRRIVKTQFKFGLTDEPVYISKALGKSTRLRPVTQPPTVAVS